MESVSSKWRVTKLDAFFKKLHSDVQVLRAADSSDHEKPSCEANVRIGPTFDEESCVSEQEVGLYKAVFKKEVHLAVFKKEDLAGAHEQGAVVARVVRPS